MLKERTMTYVWRCPDCSSMYDGESLPFLYTDGANGYCPCGGLLVEDVAPERERHYRLVIPELLVGTLLHRQLEELVVGEDRVEVTSGRCEDRHINLHSCG
jgi:hypothetical protein